MIDRQEFLDVIFGEIADDEHVCLSRATAKRDGSGVWFNNFLERDRAWRKWNWEKQAQAWYYNVSTVDGELNHTGKMVGRGRANLKFYYILVLDDIFDKTDAPAVEPTYKMETSPGSQQWGYCLEKGKDFDKYEGLLEFIHGLGFGDKGAGGSYRVVRMIGSANLKPGKQLFRSKLLEWHPERFWTLDALAEEFGCNFDNIQIEARHDAAQTKDGGAIALDGIDPMLDWLVDRSLVVSDPGGDFVTIKCPWGGAHTSGDDTAGYSPLGRGAGDWVQRRSFRCLHEHCKDRKFPDFTKWAIDLGGPAVAGYDPLPWLQARYVYIETGQFVADIEQRPTGGRWMWELADFKLKHTGRMMTPGRDNPVAVATAFLEDSATRRAVDTLYRPVAPGLDRGTTEAYHQIFVNTYVPPNWPETDKSPDIFLEHVAYLVPVKAQREIFLNWLAFKVQHPASRSYAIVMIAEDSFGIGRSWLKDMIAKYMQGKVNTASLAQLIGKGTSAEQTYNDWQAGCQYIVIEEAKDSGLTRDDFYHGYETFKEKVDTKVAEDQRINPKFGRTRMENIYYNALIFSNHADAMAVPEGDRRLFVIENPTKRKDFDYYERLTGALHGDEPARVYWWLMRRDVTAYDQIYPPMTPGKAQMIQDTRAPSDIILDYIIAEHASDLVTAASLKRAVILAAHRLDHEKIMREPSTVCRMIWRKIKNLRPDAPKHGARYKLEGRQCEVRALRDYDKWLAVDVNRGTSAIENEYDKAVLPSNVVPIVK